MTILEDKINQFIFHLDHKGENKIKILFDYGTLESKE
jgi:hypothetical protein